MNKKNNINSDGFLDIFRPVNQKDQKSFNNFTKGIDSDKGALWYPSAGMDFSPLLNFDTKSEQDVEYYIYSDYEMTYYDRFENGLALEYNNSKVEIKNIVRLELKAIYKRLYQVNKEFIHFDHFDNARATIMNFEVKEAGVVVKKGVLLYLHFENFNVFEILCRFRVNVSHFVKICEGTKQSAFFTLIF